MAVQLLITQAGLDALVDAQAGETESIQVVEVGLTASAFTMAPTITAVPGEFKRIDTISGASASETILHMTAQDSSADVYDLRGIGLYLANGTLFAVYSQPSPLFRKVSIAAFLLALDIAFANGGSNAIVFGDASFLLPPATETIKGVAEIATAAETATGTDDNRIVTPLKLKQRLDALASAVGVDISGLTSALASLLARTIMGGGLVTGGGNLTASRTLTVAAALASDVATGTATDRAVTPAALSGLARSLGNNGYAILPGAGGLMIQWGAIAYPGGGGATFNFPISFPNAAFRVIVSQESSLDDGDESDETLSAQPISAAQFSVTVPGDSAAASLAFVAIGR